MSDEKIYAMAEKAVRSVRVKATHDECVWILALAGVGDLLRERDAMRAEMVKIQYAARCALKIFGA